MLTLKKNKTIATKPLPAYKKLTIKPAKGDNFSIKSQVQLQDGAEVSISFPTIEPVEGIIAFSSKYQRLSAAEIASGKVLWERNAEYSEFLATYNGIVYAHEYDNSAFQALDPKTGDMLWKVSVPKSRETFSCTPIFDHENNFALFHSKQAVYAINLTTLKQQWKTKVDGDMMISTLYIYNGQVVAHSVVRKKGVLSIIDLKTGDIKRTIELKEPIANFNYGHLDTATATLFYSGTNDTKGFYDSGKLCSINIETGEQKCVEQSIEGKSGEFKAGIHYYNGTVYAYYEINGYDDNSGLHRFNASTLESEGMVIPVPLGRAETQLIGNVLYMTTTGAKYATKQGKEYIQPQLFAIDLEKGTQYEIKIPVKKRMSGKTMCVSAKTATLLLGLGNEKGDEQEFLYIQLPKALQTETSAPEADIKKLKEEGKKTIQTKFPPAEYKKLSNFICLLYMYDVSLAIGKGMDLNEPKFTCSESETDTAIGMFLRYVSTFFDGQYSMPGYEKKMKAEYIIRFEGMVALLREGGANPQAALHPAELVGWAKKADLEKTVAWLESLNLKAESTTILPQSKPVKPAKPKVQTGPRIFKRNDFKAATELLDTVDTETFKTLIAEGLPIDEPNFTLGAKWLKDTALGMTIFLRMYHQQDAFRTGIEDNDKLNTAADNLVMMLLEAGAKFENCKNLDKMLKWAEEAKMPKTVAKLKEL